MLAVNSTHLWYVLLNNMNKIEKFYTHDYDPANDLYLYFCTILDEIYNTEDDIVLIRYWYWGKDRNRKIIDKIWWNTHKRIKNKKIYCFDIIPYANEEMYC